MLIVPFCSMRLMNLKIAITAITSNTPITADTRINTNWFSIAFSKEMIDQPNPSRKLMKLRKVNNWKGPLSPSVAVSALTSTSIPPSVSIPIKVMIVWITNTKLANSVIHHTDCINNPRELHHSSITFNFN